MWPNKAPTHPCYSFTDCHRGSIKPLLHSSFQIHCCPTLNHPTLLKTWKIEAIRYKFFSFFIYTFLQTPKLQQHKSVQHLLLSLPSLFTLLPVAKEKKNYRQPFQDQLFLLFTDATQEESVTSSSSVCCFGNYSPQSPISLLDLQTFSTHLKTCQ